MEHSIVFTIFVEHAKLPAELNCKLEKQVSVQLRKVVILQSH